MPLEKTKLCFRSSGMCIILPGAIMHQVRRDIKKINQLRRLVLPFVPLLVLGGLIHLYLNSIEGLGGEGNNLDERSMADIRRFIGDPELCKSRHSDGALLSGVDLNDIDLIVKSNSLPKRIDFYVLRKSTGKLLFEIAYKPDRGCDGVFLHPAQFQRIAE